MGPLVLNSGKLQGDKQPSSPGRHDHLSHREVCVCFAFQYQEPMTRQYWTPTFPPTCGPPPCLQGPPWGPITTTWQPRAHPSSTPTPTQQDQVGVGCTWLLTPRMGTAAALLLKSFLGVCHPRGLLGTVLFACLPRCPKQFSLELCSFPLNVEAIFFNGINLQDKASEEIQQKRTLKID